MDRKTDDGGRLTPLEHIKHRHDFKRAEILLNDSDEIEWDPDIFPEQVGLKQVWADDNGSLWVVIRDGEKLKLKRLGTA